MTQVPSGELSTVCPVVPVRVSLELLLCSPAGQLMKRAFAPRPFPEGWRKGTKQLTPRLATQIPQGSTLGLLTPHAALKICLILTGHLFFVSSRSEMNPQRCPKPENWIL